MGESFDVGDDDDEDDDDDDDDVNEDKDDGDDEGVEDELEKREFVEDNDEDASTVSCLMHMRRVLVLQLLSASEQYRSV